MSLSLLEIHRALQENALCILDLSNRNLSRKEFVPIADDLKSNLSVHLLILSNNQLGTKSMKALSDALKKNRTIQGIRLDGNCLGQAAALHLVEALKVNEVVQSIYINSNSQNKQLNKLQPNTVQFIEEETRKRRQEQIKQRQSLISPIDFQKLEKELEQLPITGLKVKKAFDEGTKEKILEGLHELYKLGMETMLKIHNMDMTPSDPFFFACRHLLSALADHHWTLSIYDFPDISLMFLRTIHLLLDLWVSSLSRSHREVLFPTEFRDSFLSHLKILERLELREDARFNYEIASLRGHAKMLPCDESLLFTFLGVLPKIIKLDLGQVASTVRYLFETQHQEENTVEILLIRQCAFAAMGGEEDFWEKINDSFSSWKLNYTVLEMLSQIAKFGNTEAIKIRATKKLEAILLAEKETQDFLFSTKEYAVIDGIQDLAHSDVEEIREKAKELIAFFTSRCSDKFATQLAWHGKFAHLWRCEKPQPSQPETPVRKVVFQLPPLNEATFVYRKEIGDIENSLTRQAERTLDAPRTILHGTGGAGKTKLATHFVHNYRASYAFWINAEFPERVLKQFVELGNCLGLGPFSSDEEALHKVKQWFHENENWLLVFDNVSNPSFLTLPIASIQGKGSILITSRNPHWEDGISLKGFSQEEASELFQKICQFQDPLFPALAQRLSTLPLAISQAASTIKQKRLTSFSYGAKEYLEDLDKRPLKLLGERTLPSSDIHPAVLETWDIAFEELSQPKYNMRDEDQTVPIGKWAHALLERGCGFLAPTIPFSLLRKLMHLDTQESADHDYFQAVLLLLEEFGLIDIQPEQECITIHRIVQEILRIHLIPDTIRASGLKEKLSPENVEKEVLVRKKMVLNVLLNTIQANFQEQGFYSFCFGKRQMDLFAQLIPQLKTALTHHKACETAYFPEDALVAAKSYLLLLSYCNLFVQHSFFENNHLLKQCLHLQENYLIEKKDIYYCILANQNIASTTDSQWIEMQQQILSNKENVSLFREHLHVFHRFLLNAIEDTAQGLPDEADLRILQDVLSSYPEDFPCELKAIGTSILATGLCYIGKIEEGNQQLEEAQKLAQNVPPQTFAHALLQLMKPYLVENEEQFNKEELPKAKEFFLLLNGDNSLINFNNNLYSSIISLISQLIIDHTSSFINISPDMGVIHSWSDTTMVIGLALLWHRIKLRAKTHLSPLLQQGQNRIEGICSYYPLKPDIKAAELQLRFGKKNYAHPREEVYEVLIKNMESKYSLELSQKRITYEITAKFSQQINSYVKERQVNPETINSIVMNAFSEYFRIIIPFKSEDEMETGVQFIKDTNPEEFSKLEPYLPYFKKIIRNEQLPALEFVRELLGSRETARKKFDIVKSSIHETFGLKYPEQTPEQFKNLLDLVFPPGDASSSSSSSQQAPATSSSSEEKQAAAHKDE